LVGMMLEGGGLEVIDLVTDVSSEKFVEAVRDYKPAFMGLSALLTTTMPNLRSIIEALEVSGLRDQVIVMVGGAPVTQEYANEIGADIYAADAASAARKAKERL
jgi:5-methyltetrahydrofolate--homocysteine methyltransferase